MYLLAKLKKQTFYFYSKGLVRDEIRYMDTVNEVDENHCLYIRPVPRKQEQQQETERFSNSPWQRICDKSDENCIGVDLCNPFECTIRNKTIRY